MSISEIHKFRADPIRVYIEKTFGSKDPKWAYCIPIIHAPDFSDPPTEVKKHFTFIQDQYLNYVFIAQKVCFVPSFNVSGFKAFQLPIIDRIITCTNGSLPQIVNNPPMYLPSIEPKTTMTLPVESIYWDFRYWDVKEITLSSPDRQKIQLGIGSKTFDITDEQLVRLIY